MHSFYRRERFRRDTTERPAAAWSRNKMLALLAAAAAVTVLLGVGLVLAVINAIQPAPGGAAAAARPAGPSASQPAPAGAAPNGDPSQAGAGTTAAAAAATAAAFEEVAGRPMLAVPASASHPSAVSVRDPGPPIVLPPATGVGPAGVATGFGHSPQGALAQLAAIDRVALSSASLAGVRAVITGWAVPGGPSASTWTGVQAMAGLLTATGLPGGGSGQLAVVATPLMGLLKDSVGPDLAVPCVDFEVDVTVSSTARGAVGDCQRMVWTGGRWMIGAGPEPAAAPSVWPDSDLAVQVGYRDLRRG